MLTKMLEGVILQENSFCDGIDGVNNQGVSTPASSSCSGGTLCQKRLLRAGAENYNTGPSRADCKAMVERDPECSAVFTWSKTKYNGACYCQLKTPGPFVWFVCGVFCLSTTLSHLLLGRNLCEPVAHMFIVYCAACCGDCLPVTDVYQSRYWDTSSTTF